MHLASKLRGREKRSALDSHNFNHGIKSLNVTAQKVCLRNNFTLQRSKIATVCQTFSITLSLALRLRRFNSSSFFDGVIDLLVKILASLPSITLLIHASSASARHFCNFGYKIGLILNLPDHKSFTGSCTLQGKTLWSLLMAFSQIPTSNLPEMPIFSLLMFIFPRKHTI